MCIVGALCACGPAPSASDEALLCADAPVVTYQTFGAGFLRAQCQGCHASTAIDRHGAPPASTFDTEDDALAQRDRILARVLAPPGDPPMPPAGGVVDDDRARLELWLRCTP